VRHQHLIFISHFPISQLLCPSPPHPPQPTTDHLSLYSAAAMSRDHMQNQVHMRLLITFHRVSAVLNPTSMCQWNSSNAPCKTSPPVIVALTLSRFLKYVTNRCVSLWSFCKYDGSMTFGQALFVAPRPVRVNRRRKNTLLARCVAFLCCAPTQESGGS